MNFIANLQTAEKVMPAVRPLDHPAVSFLPSSSCRGGNAAMGDVGDVTSPLCREADVVVVVTLISAQMLLDVSRRGPGDDERIQRRPETHLIVDVGSREFYPKRVFDSNPAVLAVSPFAMERQLYSLATHGATS